MCQNQSSNARIEMKTIITLFAALIASISVNAQTACNINADVYYINGVNNPDYRKVKDQADLLHRNISLISKKAKGVKNVTLLHNHSDGLFLDLIYEFAQQKALERAQDISDTFVSVGMTALGHLGLSSEEDTKSVQQIVAKMIASNLMNSSLKDLESFKSMVGNDSLYSGVQAVLVSHSQGNMFANTMYDDLKALLPARYSRGLGVVNVANPANRAPSNLYLTVNEDLVIGGLSLLAGIVTSPMPANFNATGASLIDPLGHSFSSVYLSQRLPVATDVAKSVGWTLINKIDTALYKTSTFMESSNFMLDASGNKVPKPVWMPADSTFIQVCFPSLVGGL